MEENSETIMIKYNKNEIVYPIELKYNFCSCLILISSKIYNATYTVSINYDDEECEIKCLTKLKSKTIEGSYIYIGYDHFENKIYLYCDYMCPQDTIFTTKIIY